MQIRCPFCRHDIVVKGAKSGLFQPKCPACGQGYVLAIPSGKTGTVLTAKSLEHLRAYHAKQPGQSQVLEAVLEDEEATIAKPAVAAAAAGGEATIAAPPPTRMPPRPAAMDATVAHSRPRTAPPTRAAPGPPPPQVAPDATIAAPPPPPLSSPAHAAGAPTGEAAEGRLGGYQLVRLLGRGGMGEVFLARQLSLDRFVALKTISPQWASDPVFLSRFTREAFAAAQLSHHNVVQIHDIGEDEATHFFSMEYVTGQSLDDLVKERGRLEVADAVGYILQAARGLKYAHDHGMVHRDVKPANLLLSDQGVVKVADLGLVKRRGGGPAAESAEAASPARRSADVALTSLDAIGTPLYMPPEQATNAAAVDARADIYALGATLYRLVTGRPLFDGTTVEELLRQHAKERPIPPEQVNPAVPKQLSLIILTMVAKRPEDRYASLDEAIASLDGFLTQVRGTYTPGEQESRILEAAASGYRAASASRARLIVMAACLVGFIGLAVAGLLLDRPWMTAAGIGAALLAPLADAAVLGLTGRGPLFSRLRQMAFTAGWSDWLITAVAVAAVVLFVVVLDLHFLYLGVLVVVAGIAAALHFTLDRAAAQQREPQLDAARGVIKTMRLRGMDEDAIRRFIARFAGEHWEAMFEGLFGYEAMLAARRQRSGDHAAAKRPYGAWRDPLVRWLDERLDKRRKERQLRHLRAVEERRLRAEGKTEEQAKKQAQREAAKLVEHAGDFHQRGARGAAMVVAQMLGKPPPRSRADLDEDDEIPDSWKLQRAGAPTQLRYLLLGPHARLVLGGALLVVATMWVARNGIPQPGPGETVWQTVNAFAGDRGELVDLPLLPRAVERVLCSPGALLAGALLLVSGLYRGTGMTWLLLPPLLILLAGPLLAPNWGGVDGAILTSGLGLVLGVVALRLGSRS